MAFRRLEPTDAGGSRALADAAFQGTPFHVRLLELLAVALAGDDCECLGLIRVDGDEITGLVLFGDIGGAEGVIKVHAMIGEVGDAIQHLPSARMFVAEIAEAHASPFAREGFTVETRVADYYADRIDLIIMVRR